MISCQHVNTPMVKTKPHLDDGGDEKAVGAAQSHDMVAGAGGGDGAGA